MYCTFSSEVPGPAGCRRFGEDIHSPTKWIKITQWTSPGHTLILFLPKWNPQIALAMSAASCFSLFSIRPGIMQVKGRWFSSLGLSDYTKQGAWTFSVPNPSQAKIGIKNPFPIGILCLEVPWECVSNMGWSNRIWDVLNKIWTPQRLTWPLGTPDSGVGPKIWPLIPPLVRNYSKGILTTTPPSELSFQEKWDAPWINVGAQGYFCAYGDRGNFLASF